MEEGQEGPPIPKEERVGFGNEQGGKVELDIPQEGSLLKEASRLQQEMRVGTPDTTMFTIMLLMKTVNQSFLD